MQYLRSHNVGNICGSTHFRLSKIFTSQMVSTTLLNFVVDLFVPIFARCPAIQPPTESERQRVKNYEIRWLMNAWVDLTNVNSSQMRIGRSELGGLERKERPLKLQPPTSFAIWLAVDNSYTFSYTWRQKNILFILLKKWIERHNNKWEMSSRKIKWPERTE